MKEIIKSIYRDIRQECLLLRLALLQWFGAVRILLAVMLAEQKKKAWYRHQEKVISKNPKWKPLYMNFNVVIMNDPVIREVGKKDMIVDFKEVFRVASDDDIITLARKLNWLPKRMTAAKMEKRNSVFYHTLPKMKVKTAIKNYNRYLKREFWKKHISVVSRGGDLSRQKK